jgi:magnesium-protoporphyrin O-methyltransferase
MTEVATRSTYDARRAWLEEYFDRTAAQTWAKLTSNAPVGRIRASVRAGRERMRTTLLSWLPDDLSGRHILDAGCGTGMAAERLPAELRDRVRFLAGDMLDERLGPFDHVLAMDSLIHYASWDMVESLRRLTSQTTTSVLFTFAPKTPLLATMHAVGSLFPRGNRSPRIEPVAERRLRTEIAAHQGLAGWSLARTERIQHGFYTSQAAELTR